MLRKAAVDVSGKDNRWDVMRVETNAQPYVPFTGTFGTRLWEEMQGEVSPQADDREAEIPELPAKMGELERKSGLARENPAPEND